MTSDIESITRTEWGGECFFCHYRSYARGVAILFKNCSVVVHNLKRDTNGNLIGIDLTCNDFRFSLITLYGPNSEDPSFYEYLQTVIDDLGNAMNVICGDWNLVQDSQLDLHNYQKVNNPNARAEVSHLKYMWGLCDPWRVNNSTSKQYTWRQLNPPKAGRLDFFLITEALMSYVCDANIQIKYKTDHSAISLNIRLSSINAGRGFWKFNNSLLNNNDYVYGVKQVINENIKRYCVTPYNLLSVASIPHEEISFVINDQLFFECLLCDIRGFTIYFSSKLKKQNDTREKMIENDLKVLEQCIDVDNDEDINKLTELSNELESIRNKKLDGIFIRSRAKWVEYGEKPSKYFLSLEKRNHINKLIPKLVNDNGDDLFSQKDIMDHVIKFYKRLYSNDDFISHDVNLNHLLSNVHLPQVPASLCNGMSSPIAYTELSSAVFGMKNNKSPGPDGFTVEFFKTFWSDISHFLMRSFNYGLLHNALSITQKQSIITLIPKNAKHRTDIKNWRPISLLNISYKILSVCIANRIKNALPFIINDDQKGFMKGRFIGDNIRVLYDLMAYLDSEDLPGLLLIADFEKAFDTLNRDFIWNVLDIFGFSKPLIEWCKILYTDTCSSVLVNGHPSPFFSVNRGCRQGDPLSPYLFLVSIEILGILIRSNVRVRGIPINNEQLKISQYADDSIFFLDGSEDSLKECVHTIDFFYTLSGLKMNYDKSSLVWIGSKKNSPDRICSNFNFTWITDQVFEYLGITFSVNLSSIPDLNYGKALSSINSLIGQWSKRNLTVLGKVVVVKSLLLSKLTYVATALPSPSKTFLTNLQSLFFKFIWGSTDRIKRDQLVQNYNQGGVKMVNIYNYIKSLKLRWIRGIGLSSDKWVRFFNYYFYRSYRCNSFFEVGRESLSTFANNIPNTFWKDVIFTWIDVLKCFYESNDVDWNILKLQSIWYNTNFQVNHAPIFCKLMYDVGVRCVNDILDSNGNFYSHCTFNDKYGSSVDFLTYHGIVCSIKDTLRRHSLTTFDVISNCVYSPFPFKVFIRFKNKSKNLYNHLTFNKHYDPLSRTKWNIKLSLDIDCNNWSKINIRPFLSTNDTKLQWFQFRITNRILSCNSFLKKIKVKDNDFCSFCKGDVETIVHIFYDCSIVSAFWSDFADWIKTKTSFTLIITAKIVLFGTDFDKILNCLILLAKYYIYKCKFTGERLSVISAKSYIQRYYNIQKYNSTITNCNNKFETDWKSWLPLFS